jgi:hypothetical protein
VGPFHREDRRFRTAELTRLMTFPYTPAETLAGRDQSGAVAATVSLNHCTIWDFTGR